MPQSKAATANAELPVRTGIARKDRQQLASALGRALASSYVLYHKIHAYHWNITGPMFYSIHTLTDAHYADLGEAIDKIAERIRSIGFSTPVGLANYLKSSVVADVDALPSPEEMVAELAADHQALAKALRDMVGEADDAEDVYTADLLTARIGAHEEAAWMLNASLEGTSARVSARGAH